LALLNTHDVAQISFWNTLASPSWIWWNCLHWLQINSLMFDSCRCRVEGWAWRSRLM
jgi:hypothetical protein